MHTAHDRCAISMLIQALSAAVHPDAPAVVPTGLRGIGNGGVNPVGGIVGIRPLTVAAGTARSNGVG